MVTVSNFGTVCTLTPRNDGYGPAMIVSPTPSEGGIQVPQDVLWQMASVSAQLVAPGDTVVVTGSHPGQPSFGRLYLRVGYTDVLGEQRTTTWVHIEQRQKEWKVTGSAHRRENQPLQKWGDGWDTEWVAREGLS